LQHATRLLLAAHLGQILVSEKSAVLLRDDLEQGVDLLDLGPYRLREDTPPERLLQVCFPDMPVREFPPPHALPAHEGSLPLQFRQAAGCAPPAPLPPASAHGGGGGFPLSPAVPPGAGQLRAPGSRWRAAGPGSPGAGADADLPRYLTPTPEPGGRARVSGGAVTGAG